MHSACVKFQNWLVELENAKNMFQKIPFIEPRYKSNVAERINPFPTKYLCKFQFFYGILLYLPAYTAYPWPGSGCHW